MTLPAPYPARCLLAVVSGAVCAAAFPPIGWGWLIFPGIAGLLLALRGQHGTRARALGFLHGMAAFSLSLSWLYLIFAWMAILLWAVLAAFTAMFAHMQGRAFLRGITGWKFALFTAVNWGGWEFIRAELSTLKFPWMTPGLAVGPNLLLPWIGVYGVSVLAVLTIALLIAGKWKFATVPAILLLAGHWLLEPFPEPKTDDPSAVKVAGIQFEGAALGTFLAATRALPAGTQHVIWPEYALPFDIRISPATWESVQSLCRERGITLTFGTKTRQDGSRAWWNTALTIDPSSIRGDHRKNHTVHFFDDGTPGKDAGVFDTSHGKIGTPICFDNDFEDVARRMTAAGAEMLLIPSMDAQTWTVRQHDQHAELFRIRACENGRWLFVCATSGVSQAIDPHGHVHARLGAMETGALTATIKRETGLTFYTRFGWLFPWGVLGTAAVCWLALSWPGKFRRRAKRQS